MPSSSPAPSSAAPSLPDFLQDLGHGIYAVDTGFQRPRFDAAYLIVDDGHAAFVDTGTAHAVPRLLASLTALGLSSADVVWVIPTHVHLDHAGGVGQLMQHLPNATLLVHPRGLRHLVDPAALYQGALAVYGQAEMDRSYGALLAVPAERAQPSHDGQTIALGQRELTLIDTPGHARHHHCIWDPVSRGWFTGDSFGLSYRELDTDGQPWILPTTTPVQFEPDAARATIRRLMAQAPERVYLTHYGALGPVAPLGEGLLHLLDEVETLGLKLKNHPDRHAALSTALLALYEGDLRAAGNTLPPGRVAELLALDVELNAQGMACWLDRPAPAG